MPVKTNNPKKILFMSVPADGHFSPLTGLAKHLQSAGHDVRWYTQDLYREKLARLDIPFYSYVTALQLNQHNFESFFKDRAKQKSQPAKFRFDLEHCFIRPAEAGLIDVEAIHQDFEFDLVIADLFTFCLPLIKARFNVPVIAVGVVPLMLTSPGLPPVGLGLAPSGKLLSRIRHALLHVVSHTLVFKKPTRLFRTILNKYGVSIPGKNVFDMLYHSADVVLQSGTPSFEYRHDELPANIHFAGPLLPYIAVRERKPWFDERLNTFRKVVLVTQGTVEKDFSKLLVPTLEALKDTDTLVVCTTGGSGTTGLRTLYNHPNIIIEDFIPFDDIMPHADVYITNGGYGGVLLGIRHGLPMIVAGVHEGKNEICARVGYFGYGIDMKTERPRPGDLKSAVDTILTDPAYRFKVRKLGTEFSDYNPARICQAHAEALTTAKEIAGYFSAEEVVQTGYLFAVDEGGA